MFRRASLIVGLSLICTTAFAADYRTYPQPAPIPVPVNDPPPPPPPAWGGCYVGVNAGVGAFTQDRTLETNSIFHGYYINDSTVTTGYPVLGGQLGCNYLSGSFLGGFEGGVSTGHREPTHNGGQGDPSFYKLDSERGPRIDLALRGGYVMDNVLIFGKVGVAYQETKYKLNVNEVSYLTVPSSFVNSSGSAIYRPLWQTIYDASSKKKDFLPLIGIGAEYAFHPSWTVKLEVDATFAQSTNTDLVVDHVGQYNNRNANPPTGVLASPSGGSVQYIGYDNINGRDPVLGDILKLKTSLGIDVNMKLGINRRF